LDCGGDDYAMLDDRSDDYGNGNILILFDSLRTEKGVALTMIQNARANIRMPITAKMRVWIPH